MPAQVHYEVDVDGVVALSLDHPSLPHLVDATLDEDDRIRRLAFSARGTSEIVTGDLRTKGLTKLLRGYATLARQATLEGLYLGQQGVEAGADVAGLLEMDLRFGSADARSLAGELLAGRQESIEQVLRAQKAAGRVTRTRRARSRANGDERAALIQRVVERYRDLTEKHHSRSPRVAIARELGYSNEHIGGLLVEARKQGLLPPARRGKAGSVMEAS